MTEGLLGYDIREMCFNAGSLWPRKRRDTYLLRHDSVKPLSVDTIVWPSVFDAGQGAGMYESQREAAGIPAATRLGWVGPNIGLWTSHDDLLSSFNSQFGSVSCDSMVVAVTLVTRGANRNQTPPYIVGSFRETNGWHLLGYDVADPSQLSGLTNCGFSTAEKAGLVEQWSEYLNEHHLFTDPARAFDFGRVADSMVPEHRPFYVYGLWSAGAPSMPHSTRRQRP